MRTINTSQSVKIPKGVTASVSSRTIKITGKLGTLTRTFKHLAVDVYMPGKRTVKVEKWFGSKKELAAVRTVCSHIQNMIKGEYHTITTAIHSSTDSLFPVPQESPTDSCTRCAPCTPISRSTV